MHTNASTKYRRALFDYSPTGATPIYRINPEVTGDDMQGYLAARLEHLHAHLITICGEGGETFRRHSDSIQDSYVFGCAALAAECKALFAQLNVEVRAAS